MTIYTPATDEADHKKQNMSLQLIGSKLSTAISNVATNTANIVTNTANIVTNTANIATNAANIATNTSNIATNTTNIATNAASIAAMQAAWTTYTPTVTATSGTFTTVSAAGAYLAVGKHISFTVTITITTVGTAAGNIVVTLPTGSAKRNAAAAAREIASSGVAGIASMLAAATTMQIVKYDATTLAGSGNIIAVTGVYEAT